MKLAKDEMVGMPQPVVKGEATHRKNMGIKRVASWSHDISWGTSAFSTLGLNGHQFNYQQRNDVMLSEMKYGLESPCSICGNITQTVNSTDWWIFGIIWNYQQSQGSAL